MTDEKKWREWTFKDGKVGAFADERTVEIIDAYAKLQSEVKQLKIDKKNNAELWVEAEKKLQAAEAEIERWRVQADETFDKRLKERRELTQAQDDARRLAEALEFYAQHKNLDTDGYGINWPTGHEREKNWRIGQPYLISAEMGQTACEALTPEIRKKYLK